MRFNYNGKVFTASWRYDNDILSTVARIKDESGEVVAEAVAYCSMKDQFDKKKGRKLAFARAIRQFVPREHRLPIWEAYADQINDGTMFNVLWNWIVKEEHKQDEENGGQ